MLDIRVLNSYKLDKKELTQIYEQYVVRHFPQNEVKPLKSIYRMWEIDSYCGLGMYAQETNELVGYAFFVQVAGSDMVLLDYFAILEQHRSHGAGAAFLNEMSKYMNGFKGILLETEDILYAENDAEVQERSRRNDFYRRMGTKETGIHTKVYAVPYAVWYYSFSQNKEVDQKECVKNIEVIYHTMIPDEKYEKNVSVTVL
ncbi:MAG: GNAT family N-acetyltransferase [Clostridia bacterium]|nr:GNAT family N-acetyltransferase [Clostridia bacterium]NCC44491.1 GNAT family N-acetyltransferase [Clostridia bacterium]